MCFLLTSQHTALGQGYEPACCRMVCKSGYQLLKNVLLFGANA